MGAYPPPPLPGMARDPRRASFQLQGDRTTPAAATTTGGTLTLTGTVSASVDTGAITGTLNLSGVAAALTGADIAGVYPPVAPMARNPAAASFQLAGGRQTTVPGSVTGGGTLVLTGTVAASGDAGTVTGSLTLNGTASVQAPVTAAGTLTLTGTSTGADAPLVAAGTLILAGTAAGGVPVSDPTTPAPAVPGF